LFSLTELILPPCQSLQGITGYIDPIPYGIAFVSIVSRLEKFNNIFEDFIICKGVITL